MGKRDSCDSEQIGPQSSEADDLVKVSQPLAYPASADVCFEPWFVNCLCGKSETAAEKWGAPRSRVNEIFRNAERKLWKARGQTMVCMIGPFQTSVCPE